ncbi:toxin-antitoxin system antitoxin component, TIGR02293 family protein [Pseudomonas syringae pv. syringae PD2766]|uniref:antitoxin Xre-like helix-turn-helix domain-containing protein n=1 Tax=Pseudomonas syringae TaxID=317 RepID=UPI000736FA8B|nr:antitoxin Xre-like helix-turn-helix domain-containing protein [Pseudomonas syringae]KTB87905.1 toxin-antitoxin system antitoxin component, TIGR02293 family protein [Pseudomonas syringae pv. syringae PD2766]
MSLTTPLSERRRAAAGFWLLALQLSQGSEAQRLANIQAGFAPGWVRAMRDAFALGPRQMESLFNLSTSTLERRQRQQQPLNAVASERLDRVAMLASHAMRVFETPERAGHWMITSNVALDAGTPLQACETGIGAAQAHRALATLESAGAVPNQRAVSTTTRPRT